MYRGTIRSKQSFYAAAALAVIAMAGAAQAQVVGFGGSTETGWQANANAAAAAQNVPNVSGTGTSSDVLTLTSSNGSEGTSYWYTTPQDITNFTESFTYTDVTKNGADGVGVVWQNNTQASSGQSINALGGTGSTLGFVGLTNTAGLAMNVYGGYASGSSSAYNPYVAAGSPLLNPSMGGVNLDSGDPINVSLTYSEANNALSETMTDTLHPSQTFTRVYRSISIASTVGGSTGYIGFTGGTGGVNTVQNITNFQFTPTAGVSVAPAPIAPITVTGFNENMIVSKQYGSANLTATVDNGQGGSSNTFFEQGVDAKNSQAGVPQAGVVFGSISDPNHSFMLAPNGAGQNDVLMLDSSHTSGTLSLVSSTQYSVMSFLVTGGNGGGTISATINYANGSTQVASLSAPDWFSTGPTVALYTNGRAQLTTTTNGAWTYNNEMNSSISSGSAPKLFQDDVTLSDTVDPVTSISFSYTGANRTMVLAVSGTTVPEPASVAGILLSAAGLLGRRRRSC